MNLKFKTAKILTETRIKTTNEYNMKGVKLSLKNYEYLFPDVLIKNQLLAHAYIVSLDN